VANWIEIPKKSSNKKKVPQTKSDLKRTIGYTSKKEKTEITLIEDEIEHIENLIENNYGKEAMKYIAQDKKATIRLIEGVNCSSNYEVAYNEMMIIKRFYNKEGGRMFKHFIHSYSDIEQVDPIIAHEISIKLLERQKKFKGFQIFAATHIDKKHIHTHYILNTVNMDTGRKWQQSNTFLAEMRKLSNKICKEYGLKHSFVYEQNERHKSKSINRGELRAKQNNRSWKHELSLAVNECKKISKSREEFIKNMEELNYKVRWEDSRKYITFTAPNGKLCRNSKLENPEDYTKEALEKVFSINQQVYDLSKEKTKENIENLGDIQEKNKRSWKYPLYVSIKEGLKFSTSREEFIEYMNNEGYQVRWEDSRKNITFITSEGKKCNNDKLHPPENFTKEALEKKFRLNKNSINKSELKEKSKQQFKKEKSIQAIKNIILETIKMLEAYPELGDKDYPLSYLEGQALKEKMIEKAKGEGLDWEKERER